MSDSKPAVDQRFFASAPVSVGLARDFADKSLLAWGLDALADDVRLCVSELATNAVVHGMDDDFLVRLIADDQYLHLEVHDEQPLWPEWRSSTRTMTSGRGLHLVAALSVGWGVEPGRPSGKIVWSRFRIAAVPQEMPC
ncbi:ATP-binding protein [Streptomyces telluris]|uniref:ATP-binding protein n=1 Tax=Streptomyces telluris TaxID=2720021 RepID=A0A9X2RN94_9ACTN|nr:ATP-binding protein [Streptomyces telluris]MCQ8769770.1 ATP-binding protein [Streptomyces telluris]NJP79618.1 ATP-binding protein [Streptomyces telluris]